MSKHKHEQKRDINSTAADLEALQEQHEAELEKKRKLAEQLNASLKQAAEEKQAAEKKQAAELKRAAQQAANPIASEDEDEDEAFDEEEELDEDEEEDEVVDEPKDTRSKQKSYARSGQQGCGATSERANPQANDFLTDPIQQLFSLQMEFAQNMLSMWLNAYTPANNKREE